MFCTTSALDLFVEPAVSASVDRTIWCTYQPLSSLESGPIEFYCAGSDNEYLDLSKTCLQLKAKVVHGDGSSLLATDDVSTTNLFLHSLFSKVDVFLNDVPVTDSIPTYPFKAYLQTLVNYGSDAKGSQLITQMYHKDPITTVAAMQVDGHGYVKRKSAIALSKSVELLGRLHVDLFNQERYMLNNVSMKVSLNRASTAFALISTAANASFKIVIEAATLFVRKVKIAPSVLLTHAKVLHDGAPALYPINQTVLKNFSIAQGLQDVSRENIWLNKLPVRMLVCFVETSAFTGAYAKNPYNFAHYELNHLAFYLDGEQIPARAFTPDFERKHYTREYLSTFATTDLLGRDKGFCVDYTDFRKGNAIFAVDLTSDETSGASHFELPRNGNLSISIKFKNPLPTNVTCLMLAEFETLVTVDKNRQVLCQGSV